MTKGDTKIKPIASIDTALQHAHATGAVVTITLPQAARGAWIIHGVSGFYDDTPSGGRVTIAGGGFNLSWPITGGGAGFIPIPPAGGGQQSDNSSDIVITLANAGATIRGDLNVHAELM